jgi:hypothetical protein
MRRKQAFAEKYQAKCWELHMCYLIFSTILRA